MAEDLERRIRIADERAKDPTHLGADQREDEHPGSEQAPGLAGVAAYGIQSAQNLDLGQWRRQG